MPEGIQHLAVLLAGRYVADLRRTRSRTLRLTYCEDARRPGGTPLSLSLPLDVADHVGAPVQAFLAGLVPESPGALDALARRYRVHGTDAMEILSVIGKDCAGAVQFCREDELEQTIARQGSLEPFSDADIEARLDAMDTDENASWTMPGEHWSLGGTQQKFTLRRHQDAWFIAHGASATTHIVKPGIRKMKAQALAEHVSMRVAHRLDLDVARTEFASFKSREAIVIERFDRRQRGDEVVRLHQEDLCQALGTWDKYEERGGPSAAQIITRLRTAAETAAQARDIVRRFVDALVFNTAIGAPDAHARNFAVLLNGDSVDLAPMYDVATGFAYDMSAGTDRKVSMSIGGTFLLDEIGPDAWQRFAVTANIDGDALVDRVREITDRAPQAFDEAFDELDDADGGVAELRQRIATTLAARRAQSGS